MNDNQARILALAALGKAGAGGGAELAKRINQNKEDISELSERLNDVIEQGIQQTPLFAESVEWLNENGDTSKVYVLPDGYIYMHIYIPKP